MRKSARDLEVIVPLPVEATIFLTYVSAALYIASVATTTGASVDLLGLLAVLIAGNQVITWMLHRFPTSSYFALRAFGLSFGAGITML